MVDFCTRLTASGLTIWLGKILSNPTKGIPVALTSASVFTFIAALILMPGIFRYAKDNFTTLKS